MATSEEVRIVLTLQIHYKERVPFIVPWKICLKWDSPHLVINRTLTQSHFFVGCGGEGGLVSTIYTRRESLVKTNDEGIHIGKGG